jgi:hypothetical protein
MGFVTVSPITKNCKYRHSMHLKTNPANSSAPHLTNITKMTIIVNIDEGPPPERAKTMRIRLAFTPPDFDAPRAWLQPKGAQEFVTEFYRYVSVLDTVFPRKLRVFVPEYVI